jgi:hypothetical protein
MAAIGRLRLLAIGYWLWVIGERRKARKAKGMEIALQKWGAIFVWHGFCHNTHVYYLPYERIVEA